MIETLHMTMDVLSDAKVEIFVFILASCLHYLLFGTRVPSKAKPVVSKRQFEKHNSSERPVESEGKPPGPAECICHALVQPLSSADVQQDLIEKNLRKLLDHYKVPEEETQAVLASACEGLGRLISIPALLSSIQAIVGTVSNAHLAENLLRGFWSGRHYADFDKFLFEFGDFCKSSGTQMPRQAIVLSIQFVVAAEQIETEAAQKQKARLALMGRGDASVDLPKVLSWEKLEIIMKDFLPMLDDDDSRYVSFHRILDVMVKRDCDKCWDVIKHMEKQQLPPNNVTCSILLKAVRKPNQDKFLTDVMKVIDAREANDIDEVLLGSLYEACIRCGQMKQLLEYVQKLRQKGGLVEIHSPHTAGSIIRAYGAMGDMKGVWDTWNDMNRRGVEPTRITLGCMVEALASNDNAEGAYEVIQWALGDPRLKGLVTAVTYSSVLKSLNHQRCFRRVWEIYDEMIREKVEFSTTTYNALLDVCARSGEISRAEPLLKQMADQGVAPSIITYSTVMKAYCASNQLEKAFKLFEELKMNTELDPDEVTFNTLLDGCARYGLFDRGCDLLSEMKESGIPPSNYTLSVMAKLANRSKKPKMAFEIVEGLRDEYGIKINMHVYNNLIHAAVLDGDVMKAQETFADMLENKIHPDGRTYALMLRSMLSHKLVGPATVLLHVAFGLKIQDPRILSEQLHHSLMKQLSQPIQWAKAPLQNGNRLQEDVVTDTVEFLSRMDAPGLPKLLAAVSTAMPSAAMA